jgi:hypothetical protein
MAEVVFYIHQNFGKPVRNHISTDLSTIHLLSFFVHEYHFCLQSVRLDFINFNVKDILTFL